MAKRYEPVARDQHAGAMKAEVFVGPAFKHGKKCWRWDVTFLQIADVDRTAPGLLGVDGRTHMAGECGYARTQAGAWRALRHAFHSSPFEVV